MTSQTPSSALALEAQADRAAGHGGLVEARRLLGAATRAEPGRIEPWLKLAAICRGLGDLPGALSAVEGALTAEPLGYVPLLLKANILEKLGRQEVAIEAARQKLITADAEEKVLREELNTKTEKMTAW